MKTPRNLAFILGLGIAACSSKPISIQLVEAPQEDTQLDSHIEEDIVSVCFPLDDCTSHYNTTIQEPPQKQTIEDLVDDLYKKMTDTKTKRMYVKQTIKHINKFDHLFEIYAKKYSKKYGCNIDKTIGKAIAYVESRGKQYNEDGEITTGAIGELGMMQLKPTTAEWLGVNPHILWQNIKGGIKYIGILLKHYNGNIVPAITAYNAGQGKTDKLIKKAGSDDFIDYREMTTKKSNIRKYTLKILTVMRLFKEGYGQ